MTWQRGRAVWRQREHAGRASAFAFPRYSHRSPTPRQTGSPIGPMARSLNPALHGLTRRTSACARPRDVGMPSSRHRPSARTR
eukprot:scaffold100011_cov30-Tisochrysis_lutea.AAC.6